MILRGLAEEVLEDGNLCQSRNSSQRFRLLIFHDSAQQIGLAVLQANLMLDLALPDDGLADAANVRLSGDRRNIHRNLQRDLSIRMHMRSNVDIHAHVEILELGVNQRVDTDTADSRLKRSRRHRHLVANLQRSLLSVESANLR